MRTLSPNGKTTTHLSGRIPLANHHRAMFRIYTASARHHDPETLFHALAAELRSVTGSPAIAMAHCDQATGFLRWFGLDIEGQINPFSPLLQWERSPFQRVWEQQQPSVIDLTASDKRHRKSLGFLTPFGVTEVCLLPLTTAYRRVGVITVSSSRTQSFSDSIVRVLLPLAGQVAQAMDHAFQARDLGRLEKEAVRLRLLLDLNNAIVSQSDPVELMLEISPRIRTVARADAVALILPDVSRHKLRLHALDFPAQKEQPFASTQTLPCDSIAGKVFHSGRVWTGNPQSVHGTQNDALANKSGLRSVCAFPLARNNSVLGVLGLGRLGEEAFLEEDIDFLAQIANQVAMAVSNSPNVGLAPIRSSDSERSKDEQLSCRSTIRFSYISFQDIVGNSPALQKVLDQLVAVAPAETTVLILGETGTGKELLAHAIHRLSSRSNGPFVKVNCAALPSGLLESELFGHERGAFTGALTQRIGRFELANHGTIFLDEISELPVPLQPKLLRVLQEREFERLGSSRTQRTGARVIAATNRDLKSMIANGSFRADLFYRLSVFPLRLPSLRERPEDIPVLADHFIRHYARNLNRRVLAASPETMRAFVQYEWPGNIRELQNVIERAVILSNGPTLEISSSDLLPGNSEGGLASRKTVLEEAERKHLLAILEDTNWVLSGPDGAAARLGMKRSTLQFRLKKLGLGRPLQGGS